MEIPDRPEYQRALSYAADRDCTIVARLGFGFDGIVLQTDQQSAIKAFEREPAYRTERDVYRRLHEHHISRIQGHAVPELLGYDDGLQVVEISIVQPPYILDFARAQLDVPPELDFPEHVMAERYEHWAELFDEVPGRWPTVLAIMRELERRCGIYLLDPTPRNIAFEEP